MLVIGVDVGGTFTDVVCSDGTRTWKAKSPTVPENFGAGVIEACELIAPHRFSYVFGVHAGSNEHLRA